MGKPVHVVPRGKQWLVKQSGRTLSEHRTQRTALDAGRPVAKRGATELVTHDREGRIRDSDSYGRDPNPPKDKKH
jgi:hypothetical protein